MIYTFYSFKGGVGRSMALANVAECFRQKRLRVLMVDWDLEAPGLEAYFYSSSNGDLGKRLDYSRSQPGLIDMLYAYKKAYPSFVERRASNPNNATSNLQATSPTEHHDRKRATEALTEQLNSLAIPDFLKTSALQTLFDQPPPTQQPSQTLHEFLDDLYSDYPSKGSSWSQAPSSALQRYLQRVHDTDDLYLLGAGSRGPDQFQHYATSVQDFDWAEFYAVFEGRQYFEWLRSRLAEMADVVLIDSRTGVTEMGGVCTRQIPDAVVSFCAPNWQNMDGVVRIVGGLNEKGLRAARDDREVDVLVIPTRIDDAESGLLSEFRDRFIQTAESAPRS